MEATEAASLAEYHLIAAGRRGSFAGRGARPIGLRSASYDPAKGMVALLPRRSFATRKPVGLAVDFIQGLMTVYPLTMFRRASSIVSGKNPSRA